MTGISPTTDTPLVGRHAELGRLRELLRRAASSQGSTVLVRGEPGLGKSALIAQLVAQAQGVTVLRCRGVEAEVELPFSGLHELLLPLMSGVGALPAEQREALNAALSMVSEPASVVHASIAALTLIANAAATATVLVIADDLHWMDESTLLVLTFLARRIAYDRVLLVAAERPGRQDSPPLGETIELAPLSRSEVEQLVAQQVDRAPANAAQAIAGATGGNPLAVIETVRLLGADLDRIGTALDEPLPPGALIERGFASRLAGLSAETRAALAVVAMAFTDSADIVGRALDELNLPTDALDSAERAGVMLRELDTVRFAHPLLRALVFHRTPADERRRVHAALASVAPERGVRAWHAASACVRSDAAVADELAEAALEFERRGGILASARALERAARVTPDRLVRARRLLEAGRAARFAGRVAWASELLDEALELTGNDRSLEMTVEIEMQRGALAAHSGATDGLLAKLILLAEMAKPMSPSTAADAAANLAYEAVLAFDAPTAIDAILAGASSAADADPVTREICAFHRGVVEVATGLDPAAGLERIRTAATGLLSAEPHGQTHWTVLLGDHWVILMAEYLWPCGEEALCDALLARTTPLVRQRGDLLTLSGARGVYGSLQVRGGNWAAAENALDEALQLAEVRGFRWYRTSCEARIANLKALRGDPDALRMPDALIDATRSDQMPFEDRLATARALFHLGAGDAGAAATTLQDVADAFAHGQMRGPTLTEWPALIVEAHALAGRPDLARHYLTEFRGRWANLPTAWSTATEAALTALLSGEHDFEEDFERAIAAFSGVRAPFDLARARLHFGRRLRRAGQRARATEQLTAALESFERLGAPQWLAQATAELDAAGAAPRPVSRAVSTLTSQESVVADLVARGLTNKQVAAQLFLTPKTIEWHLRQIYRKLGITSRTQLAAQVAQRAEPRAST